MFSHFILGAVQGVFEWIPISSEGVVALISQFLDGAVGGWRPIDLALFLHLGTLLAVLIYFRKEWKEVITLKNKKLLRFLIIATVFSLAIGYPFYKLVQNAAVGDTLLAITGLGLLLTAYFQKKKKRLEISSDKLAALTGFFQGLAVIPGLSRSGATIFSLSLGKSTPAEILKISYMISLPAVLASSSYLFLENPILVFQSWPALIFSFLVGLLSLHFLITLANKINFFKFALVFGLLCLLGAVI